MLISMVFAAATSGAFGAPEIKTLVEEGERRIGDRIYVDLFVTSGKGYDVLFPEGPEEEKGAVLLGTGPVKSKDRGVKGEGRGYVFTFFDTGKQFIPSMKVRYRKDNGTEWSVLESERVPVTIKSLLSGDDKDIRKVKGLIQVKGPISALLLALISFILIGSVFLYFIRKNRSAVPLKEEVPEVDPYERAMEELEILETEDLPGKGRIKEYYTRISDIIRRYLEDRFFFRTQEMTTEEFLYFLRGDQVFKKEGKGLLQDFLSRCDMVKFAKYGPTKIEMTDIMRSAVTLVKGTRNTSREGDGE